MSGFDLVFERDLSDLSSWKREASEVAFEGELDWRYFSGGNEQLFR